MGYDIGPRLRKYREAQNLSQKEFAKLIGVSNSRVSNWEQGINRPDVDILAKICEILKVSPSELLDICVLPNESDMFVSSPYEKEFTAIFGHLAPETQQYLLLMAKELLNTQQKLLNQDEPK